MPATAHEPVYNSIGKTYDTTRKADPFITQKIAHYLQGKPKLTYLDIGCGSGNYTGALSKLGLAIEGIDISTEMLSRATTKYPHITWHEGDARHLPFADKAYQGATCVLATHHIKDLTAAFKEVFRVLAQGRFVIFTITPEQCRHYWLSAYFPKIIEETTQMMAPFSCLHDALFQAGFKDIQQEAYYVTENTEDLFLYSGKYRPEIYLNPDVRAGISSFALSSDQDEIDRGVALLEEDIQSGKIKDVIRHYLNNVGDGLFVVGEKV